MRSGKQSGPSVWIQQAGLLTAIPFVLLVGPGLGYYLGMRIDQRWRSAPWGMDVGIVLGFIASVRVTIQFIRQAKELGDDQSDK